MAVAILVAGLADIQVFTAGATAERLGYTRNGAETTKEGFFLDVPGDQLGGDDGPPIDVQYFGEIVRVRCELTKFDNAVADELKSRTLNGTAGAPVAAGSLMFGAADKAIRLCIKSAGDPINFLRAFPRFPIEQNRGTKFSTLKIEFECHANAAGVVYNAVTTNTI